MENRSEELTRNERLLAETLALRGRCTFCEMIESISYTMDGRNKIVDENNLRVQIHRTRAKLKKLGAEFSTVRGYGYEMDSASREIVAAHLRLRLAA